MNRLKAKYNDEIIPSLREKFNYSNIMEIPKLEKIVVNMGVGDATTNSKLLDAAVADLEIITGQKPVITKSKKAIAGFKLREGQGIGCKVTLRGDNMYNFLDKLCLLVPYMCTKRHYKQYPLYHAHSYYTPYF